MENGHGNTTWVPTVTEPQLQPNTVKECGMSELQDPVRVLIIAWSFWYWKVHFVINWHPSASLSLTAQVQLDFTFFFFFCLGTVHCNAYLVIYNHPHAGTSALFTSAPAVISLAPCRFVLCCDWPCKITAIHLQHSVLPFYHLFIPHFYLHFACRFYIASSSVSPIELLFS